ARLGEVEHLLRLDTTGAAGACPQCGTLYARGAVYCSHCAFQLVQVQHAGAPSAPPAAPTPAPAALDAPFGVHEPAEEPPAR
ncbi:MAG TPA: hypothetical protein VLK58_25405, partial [Conexibacter sp.]|nr:hypothetical protein [Conexibacter sp.]